MKVLLLFTIALSSARAYGPAFIKPWNDTFVEAMKFQNGIDDLLSPICGGEKECRVLVYLTAGVCSTPSYGQICQSDCKFLLERVFKLLLVEKPQLELLKDFVPDCCMPRIQEEVDKPELTGQEESVTLLDKGEQYRMLHVGYENNWDEGIQELIFQWQFVDESINSSSCKLEQGDEDSEHKTMKPGEVLIEDCREEHSYLDGEIWGVCLNTGYLLKSSSHCKTSVNSLRHFVENEAEKATKHNPVERMEPEALEAFFGASKFINNTILNEGNSKMGALYDSITKIDNILAPVGSAMHYIAYKLNKTDPNHDAIIAAFQVFENQTNALRIEARNYPNIFQTQFIGQEVKNTITVLSSLEENLLSYSKNISKPMMDMVKDSCKHFDAGKFLLHLNQNVLEKRPRDMAWSYEFDYKKYTSSLAVPMLIYGIRCAAASIKCVGLLPKQNFQDINHLAYKLKSSLKILYEYLESVNKYIKNHAARESFEKDLTKYVEIHKGYDNFYMVQGLYPVLRGKYDFYDYALVAYDNVDDGNENYEEVGQAFNCYGCIGHDNSGFYTRHFGELGVNSHIVVMYTNSAAPLLNYSDVTNLYKKYGETKLQSFASALMQLNSKSQRVITNALAVRRGHNFASNNDTAKVGRFYDLYGVNVYFTN